MQKEKTEFENSIAALNLELAALPEKHNKQATILSTEINSLNESIAELNTTKMEIEVISNEIKTLRTELENPNVDALKARIKGIRSSLEDAENKKKEIKVKREKKDDLTNLLETIKSSSEKFKNSSKGTYDLPIMKDGEKEIEEFATSTEMFKAYQKYLENEDGEVQVDKDGIEGKMKEKGLSCIVS